MTPLRRKDIETGRRLEREAIVKWLRKDEKEFSDCDIAAHLIEQGEHLK